MKYAIIKILNVATNIGMNLFFLLLLPKMAQGNADGILGSLHVPNFEISYIFIAMIMASAVTLLLMISLYLKSNYHFDLSLWKRMMHYAWPILVAGIAYTINEMANRIMLDELLPETLQEVR